MFIGFVAQRTAWEPSRQ